MTSRVNITQRITRTVNILWHIVKFCCHTFVYNMFFRFVETASVLFLGYVLLRGYLPPPRLCGLMFAVVDIAGFQELVREGDRLQVPSLDAEEGKTVVFDRVLLISNGDDVVVGTPVVPNASVEVTVLGDGRGDKIRIVKFRRRKRYLRMKTHRQGYTEVEVKKITG